MRATISFDDHIGEAAKRRASEEGLSLSAYIVRLLQNDLSISKADSTPPPFKLLVVGHGDPPPPIDLSKTSSILSDEDILQFGGFRKE